MYKQSNFVVRTTGKREIHSTYNQIDYKKLIYTDGKPIDDFIDSLYKINDNDTVLLEDDLVLCDNFEEEVEKAIGEYPGYIINFFQEPCSYYETKVTDSIISNQCTFYPKGVAKQIADIMVTEERMKQGFRRNMYSRIENKALSKLGLQVVQYRPHLVQHLDMNSELFGITDHSRRSFFFIEYLKQLGLSYTECRGHIKELAEIRRSWFKEYEKNHNNRLR